MRIHCQNLERLFETHKDKSEHPTQFNSWKKIAQDKSTCHQIKSINDLNDTFV